MTKMAKISQNKIQQTVEKPYPLELLMPRYSPYNVDPSRGHEQKM